MINKNKTTLIQAVKYGLVGISNTLITALVIAILLKGFGCSDFVSNSLGYIAGVVNSFVWNKKWTFQSEHSWGRSAIRFGIAFAVCYVLQYCLVLLLNKHTTIDTLYNHYIGMIFYTAINFVANKLYTFR